MADQRKDYDAAGCASGCRDTVAGASVLMALFAALLAFLARKVRVRRSDRLLDQLGSAVPKPASGGRLGEVFLDARDGVEARPMPEFSALVDRFGGPA